MRRRLIITLLIASFTLSSNSLNATTGHDCNAAALNSKSKDKEDDRERKIVSTTRKEYPSVRDSLKKEGWTIDKISIKGDNVTIECSRPKQNNDKK